MPTITSRRTRRGAARRWAPDHPGPLPARRHARPSRRRARPLRGIRAGAPAVPRRAMRFGRAAVPEPCRADDHEDVEHELDGRTSGQVHPDRIARDVSPPDPSEASDDLAQVGVTPAVRWQRHLAAFPTRRTSMSPQVWAVYRRFNSAAAPYALAAATKTMMTTAPAHPPNCVTALLAMRADPPIPSTWSVTLHG